MSLLEQKKNQIEEYKKSLDDALHHYDAQIQETKNSLKEVLEKKDKGLSDEDKKELEALKWEGSEADFLNYMEGLLNSVLFYASTALPLMGIISVFNAKGNWSFSDTPAHVDYDSSALAYSAREIYNIMIQLPDSIVLNKLKEVCLKNDSDLILDTYKRRDEDGFVKAFEFVSDKQSIKDYFIHIAKGVNLSRCFDDFSTTEHDSDKAFIEDVETLGLVKDEMIQEAIDPSIIAATNGFSLMEQGVFSPGDMDKAIKLYKSALAIYLLLSPKFDSITKEYANKVIQNPEYLGITTNLLTECEEIIKKVKGERQSTSRQNDNKLFPLPFPEHLEINDKVARNIFLKALYEELTSKNYISNNTSLGDFQYLLGGEKPTDYNNAKIIWLRNKTQLHCFYVSYYGNTVGKEYGWKVLNDMFAIKGDDNLDNNPSDVNGKSAVSYKEKFTNIITKVKNTYSMA